MATVFPLPEGKTVAISREITGIPLAQPLWVSGISGRLAFDTAGHAYRPGVRTAPSPDLEAPSATNERDTVRVIADAALTNAPEIRRQLEARGHQFHSATDCEVIAHAYEEWGPRSLARLRGPFACAIWDTVARRLVLARDHIGLRRLFYALLPGGGIAFASDIQTLLQRHDIARDWSPEAIDAYLALGYVPSPLTAYQRISKLEPAQLLQVEGRGFHLEQYWDLPRPAFVSVALDERLATLGTGLRAALRGPEDPAGLLYSGSTASTVLLAASSPDRTIPITVDVEEDGSELARSEAAATRLGHARQLEIVVPDAMTLAGEFAAQVSEPIADPSAIVQLGVLRAARRHVDCALAAHGAATLWASRTRQSIQRLDRQLQDTGAARRAYTVWDDQHRRAIYTRDFSWRVRAADPCGRHLALHASHPSDDPVERALYVEMRTSLPDHLLTCAEHAAMATGVSLRYPFLDRELVVLAATTPAAEKDRGSTGNHALRRLLLRQLPRTLMPLARPRAPRHDWLRTALAAMVPSMLLTPRFDGRGIVSRVALRRVWEEHRSGRRDHASRLWALLMLEVWFERCVDSEAAGEPLEYAVLKAAA
jgi:asparagine synthase (glutamine-hydrolysing)